MTYANETQANRKLGELGRMGIRAHYWHGSRPWYIVIEDAGIIVEPEPCHFHAFGIGRCTCEGAK